MPLHFTPNPGYRGLVVVRYKFSADGSHVIGNCSYYTITGADALPERGFVSPSGAHYTRLTPQHDDVLHQMVDTLTAIGGAHDSSRCSHLSYSENRNRQWG